MKHQISKSFLVLMVVLALVSSVSRVYASEVTGTLSTAPEANNNADNTVSNTTTTQVAPDAENTIRGAVTGGIPMAQADEYANGQEASAIGGKSISNWAWITIPSLILIGALVYAFSRTPSIR